MRRSFQFSIRSILILTLVVAAYFAGWKSSEWKLRQEMEKAVQEARAEAEKERARADESLRATTSFLYPSLINLPEGLIPMSGDPDETSSAAAVLPEVKSAP